MKKYFVISDVHGQFNPMIEALNEKGFDYDNPNHILISAGDNFDRGTQNLQIYDFLNNMEGKNKLLKIKGNHDDMFENFLRRTSDGVFDFKQNGMNTTIESFLGEPLITDSNKTFGIFKKLHGYRWKILDRNPNILKFFENMWDAIIIDEYVITHGGFTLNDEGIYEAYNWTKTPIFIRRTEGLYPEYKFVFGHWITYYLIQEFHYKIDNQSNIFYYKNYIGIDAMSNYSLRVNVLVIETDSEPILEKRFQLPKRF